MKKQDLIKLRELLPSLITKLAPQMEDPFYDEFLLHGVITSLSSIMPNVKVISPHDGKAINLNYLRLRHDVDEDNDYRYIKYIREIFKEVRGTISNLAEKDLRKIKPTSKKAPNSVLYNLFYEDKRNFFNHLELLTKYGALAITNHGGDFASTFNKSTNKAQYTLLRLVFEGEWSSPDPDFMLLPESMRPRISMVLSATFKEMESLAAPKERDMLSYFLLTESGQNEEGRNEQLSERIISNKFPEIGNKPSILVELFNKILNMNPHVTFKNEQQVELDEYFKHTFDTGVSDDPFIVLNILQNYLHALIKLGTIFTIVRKYQENQLSEEMTVCDDDFHAALLIIKNSLRICLRKLQIKAEC